MGFNRVDRYTLVPMLPPCLASLSIHQDSAPGLLPQEVKIKAGNLCRESLELVNAFRLLQGAVNPANQ